MEIHITKVVFFVVLLFTAGMIIQATLMPQLPPPPPPRICVEYEQYPYQVPVVFDNGQSTMWITLYGERCARYETT